MKEGRIAVFGFAVLCAMFGTSSAQAVEPETNGNIISPIRGQIRVDFFESTKRVEERQTQDGHNYLWVIENGATGPLLQGKDGANCPHYRQFVRVTPRRLVFGWYNHHGNLVGLRWLTRSCLDEGTRCLLHVVNG